MIHQITKPKFNPNALEPFFDAATMDLHVNKHHQTYADKLNALIHDQIILQNKTLDQLLTIEIDLKPSVAVQLTNFAGGVSNHNFFWSILTPEIDQPIPDIFKPYIDPFTKAATTLFGSGWTWLVADSKKDLQIINLPNQDSPISEGLTPLLALDLWEHSYYLNYQNRRADYIAAFWHLVDWTKVSQNLHSIKP